jgi:hypothetical protein
VADESSGSYLPPEPAGPEPEIEGRPEPATQPQPAPGYAAPPQQPAPPPGQPYGAPQSQYQPPAGPGWGPPQGQGWQQPQPGWGYYQPPVPDNTPAIAGFVLSLVSIALLLFSAGLSSLISVGCSIAAIVLGRKGVKKVEAGETPKQKGLAQASFWIGISGLVLAALATLAWVAIFVAIAVDEDTRRDFENEFDDSNSITALALPAVRLMALMLA